MKTALVALLESKKVWTTIIGLFATFFGAWLAKHGFDLSDAHTEKVAEGITALFTMLLAGQALADHGKEKAKIEQGPPLVVEVAAPVEAAKPEGGFARLGIILLVAAIGLAACGASAREKTIHATYAGVVAAQAGFEAYNSARQAEIVSSAASEEDGIAQLDKYSKAREPVLKAFEVAYRALAAAAIESSEPVSGALKAAEQLHAALSTLTGGAL